MNSERLNLHSYSERFHVLIYVAMLPHTTCNGVTDPTRPASIRGEMRSAIRATCLRLGVGAATAAGDGVRLFSAHHVRFV
jgi:hypothetical protein